MTFVAGFALPHTFRQLVDMVTWSWQHSSTLPLLAAGAGLLVAALISHRREWNGAFTALSAVAGATCVCGSAVVFLLAHEFDRGQAIFERDVKHEVRRR